jgi:NAD(P)-dependent dehydrogenase (short-subunit alcohol dehydrogenase family)
VANAIVTAVGQGNGESGAAFGPFTAYAATTWHKNSTLNVLDHMLNGFHSVPMRRLIESEEIGAAAPFLATMTRRPLTGTNLVVDGGLSANLADESTKFLLSESFEN